MKIQEKLFSMQDKAYQEFSRKLIPSIEPEKIIGVRTPALRHLAKEVIAADEAEVFIRRRLRADGSTLSIKPICGI